MKSTASSRTSAAPSPDTLWRAGVGAFVLAVAGATLAGGFDVGSLEAWLPGCAFRGLTDLPCPGCGMTRALFLLTQLRVTDSLAAHPAALPLLGVAIVATLRPDALHAHRNGLAAASLLVLALLWLWRLLPAL